MKANYLKMAVIFQIWGTTWGQLLSQSFLLHFREMAQVIEDQKQVIEQASLQSVGEEQKSTIRNLTEIVEEQRNVIEETSLQRIVDEQNELIKNLTKIVADQGKVIEDQRKSIDEIPDQATEDEWTQNIDNNTKDMLRN